MIEPGWSVARLRVRATWRQRRAGYLTIVIMLALVGGLSIGAVAGARRTANSYATYVASINPSDLQVFNAFLNPSFGILRGYNPVTIRRIGRVPSVRSVEPVVGFDANLDQIKGARLRVGPGAKPPSLEGSLGGEYITEDRVTLVSGRLFDPKSSAEAIVNVQAEKELSIHVGSTMTVTLNSDAQLLSGANSPPAVRSARIRIVGLVVFPQDVADDDYDARGSAEVLITPALTRKLDTCCATYTYSALTLDGGTSRVAQVESQIAGKILPRGLVAAVGFQTDAPKVAATDQAIRPEAIAIGVFGGLAGLAVLVIVGQIIGRQLRRQAEEHETLRALGAGPGAILMDGVAGPLASVVVGSLLAMAVAVGLSPLFPLGPVRSVYPVGVGFDWTALGLGFAVFVVLLGALSLCLAYRRAPHRRRARLEERPSTVARLASTAGLPVPAVTGVRFALEPGGTADAVPVRAAILGAMLAVAVVVATVTFGSSLNRLVSQPSLYGWNWNYALFSGFAGDEDLPQHLTSELLSHDRYVVADTGVYFSNGTIDGQRDIPIIGATPSAAVSPPVLSGHGLEADNQIVLGQSTMAALHVHLDQTVEIGSGKRRSSPLVVVGTATMPAIMGPGMGVGAIVDYRQIPATVRNTQQSTIPGPQVYLIRTKGGNPAVVLDSLEGVSNTINANDSDGPAGGVTGVLRPTQIVNSGSIETIPTVLGAGLATGAVVALGITLVASVRRRRRDLALMKTLGLSGRQLATVVAWQSTVAVLIGTLVGVPAGIVVGRVLWNLFARGLHAVPSPSVPGLTIGLIALGALVLANLVAALPGRIAARTPTGLLLRDE